MEGPVGSEVAVRVLGVSERCNDGAVRRTTRLCAVNANMRDLGRVVRGGVGCRKHHSLKAASGATRVVPPAGVE